MSERFVISLTKEGTDQKFWVRRTLYKYKNVLSVTTYRKDAIAWTKYGFALRNLAAFPEERYLCKITQLPLSKVKLYTYRDLFEYLGYQVRIESFQKYKRLNDSKAIAKTYNQKKPPLSFRPSPSVKKMLEELRFPMETNSLLLCRLIETAYVVIKENGY